MEDLRHQVLALLRKQERKAARQRAGAISGSNLHGAERRGHPKVTGSTPSISSEDGERRMRKKKHHEKIIEVEPSVNVNEGWSGDIVQVRYYLRPDNYMYRGTFSKGLVALNGNRLRL